VDLMQDPGLDVLVERREELNRVRDNFPQLKSLAVGVCDMFMGLITQTAEDFNMAAWIVVVGFAVVNLTFLSYRHNYHTFRLLQKRQCL